MKKEILEKTAKEYFESATDEYKKERYNSAVVLFFKALIATTDIYILQKTGKTPSSHTERFKTTKEKFPEIYIILDKNFPFYQDSYVQVMEKELAEVIRDDTISLAKKASIKIQP